MRQVEEEGLILLAPNEIDGLVGQEVGQVSALGILGLRVGIEVEVLAVADDGFVEAALTGMIPLLLAQVPLAKHGRRIARALQRLRQDRAIQRQ